MSELWDEPSPTRRPGPVMRTAYAVVPPIRRVRLQKGPYAEAWRAHNRDAVLAPGRRWVVLGDSMSQGVGSTRHDHGWVGILDRRLRADGIRLNVVNLSVTGARLSDVLAHQVPRLEALPPSVPAGDAGDGPDLVTVMAGSNDLFGGRDGRAELPAAMRRICEVLPAGAVVCTLPQPAPAAMAANAELERADAAGRVRMVDVRPGAPRSWRGMLASDRFHPNDLGYESIADAVEAGVRLALVAGTGPRGASRREP